jgi:hypothetical protein
MRSVLLALLCLLPAAARLAAEGVPPTGACCAPDGVCSIVTREECYRAGGTIWTEGEDCQADCPATGGCCLPNGVCSILIETSCVNDGGIYQGDGAPCGAQVCWTWGRVCCIPLRNCLYGGPTTYRCVLNRWACEATPPVGLGGRWYQNDACLTVGQGACCRPDGLCSIETQEHCNEMGGAFLGDGVPCSPDACVSDPSGSCCYADGRCQVIHEGSCFESGGIIWDAFGTCQPGCPEPGACCLDNGQCIQLIAQSCANVSGRFIGTGPCTPESCAAVPIAPRSWGSIKMLYR